MQLSAFERHLINRFQGGVPVAQRPFRQMAERLDADEEQVMATIQRLLDKGWLSRFGPLYNAERLGGDLVLAAMAVPEDCFQQVTESVNALPEVAHNYRRDHWLNMWFVLATDASAATAAAIDRIERETGIRVLAFPKEREFYLGLWFEIEDDGSFNTRSLPAADVSQSAPLDELDRRIIAETQRGLPLTHEPCETVAERIGCWPSDVVRRMDAMHESGIIRRLGVVPNHYRLGFKGNGMTVWNIPDEQLQKAGSRLGAMDYVSHCYARPRHLPDWPYNLFAMVHGRNRAEVMEKVAEMSDLLQPFSEGHEVLFSSAVLKKSGMRLAV
ncbi:MAG: Lrp/AsnC family transcriptional regulator [Candidatus Thiodiazotropha sp. (ex Dulcina madagascariensis)]|nr:Lrp/AsnC family transcriptional regulator [Candidatus Thiodiazotropha sp. (ex Epidulcina cf. delphinae)]MCU7922633.1 Lrp/AsnC family transcriptional regulator [Candidatus Thiodiazotropha sp. (ex Dulcina madagascariensis)]MCU7927471.1 Lrp/AsnC family transcriptional regulator [Candidatus Thiodiazotropha sp. (ex Dulcina madagascariensis)]